MNVNQTPRRNLRFSSRSNPSLGWIPCAFIAFATAVVGYAQTATAPAGSTATPNPMPPNDQAVQLSPFQVTTTKDIGYASSTAMSATRTNELLENLPNAISVLNQDFLQDIAANNFFDAIDFAIGAENIEND